MKYISHSLEETQKIASDFVLSLSYRGLASVATVVGLYGELGAGKTTFTQEVAKVLGVEEKVASPTFVIEKIYPIRTNGRKRPTSNGASELDSKSQRSDLKRSQSQTLGKFNHLIHIDAYRIDHSSELTHLGWNEIVSDPGNLILIEWPDRVADIMPEHIQINLKTLENKNERKIDIDIV